MRVELIWPLTPVTGVRFPLGSPQNKNRHLQSFVSALFFVIIFKIPTLPPLFTRRIFGTGKAFGQNKVERKVSFSAGDWRTFKGIGFRDELARKFGLQAGVDLARGPDDTAVYITGGAVPGILFMIRRPQQVNSRRVGMFL